MAKKRIPATIFTLLLIGTIVAACRDSAGSSDEKSTLNAKIGGGDPKQVLDADEIASLTIDYTDAIPVEAIVNNEPGYEKYYDQMLQQIISLSQEFEQFELYGEEGCYLSTALLRHFDVIRNAVGNVTYAELFSKDFTKRAAVAFYLHNDEILISVGASCVTSRVAEIIQKDPDELFIFLLNGTDFDSQIASDNSLYLWSQVEQENVKVEGDYFHALDYETLAVSYSMLTDPENLIWVDFKDESKEK